MLSIKKTAATATVKGSRLGLALHFPATGLSNPSSPRQRKSSTQQQGLLVGANPKSAIF
jgi:hypothetical protein